MYSTPWCAESGIHKKSSDLPNEGSSLNQVIWRKIFLFLTHIDSREHVLHHTMTIVYSRPFAHKVPMPSNAVYITLREYLGIIEWMLQGKVDLIEPQKSLSAFHIVTLIKWLQWKINGLLSWGMFGDFCSKKKPPLSCRYIFMWLRSENLGVKEEWGRRLT